MTWRRATVHHFILIRSIKNSKYNSKYVNWKAKIQTLVLDIVILYSFYLIVKLPKWLSFCLKKFHELLVEFHDFQWPVIFHDFPADDNNNNNNNNKQSCTPESETDAGFYLQ